MTLGERQNRRDAGEIVAGGVWRGQMNRRSAGHVQGSRTPPGDTAAVGSGRYAFAQTRK